MEFTGDPMNFHAELLKRESTPPEACAEKRRKGVRQYVLWYRHSGQPQIDDFPPELPEDEYKTFNNEGEVITALGGHQITHLMVKKGIVPALDEIAPALTHLKIDVLEGSSKLYTINYLTELEKLDFSHTNLSVRFSYRPTSLSTMQTLSISDRPPTDAHAIYALGGLPAIISRLTTLKSLSLSGCRLKDLPMELSSLTQLQMLDLSNNNFSGGFPEVVCRLPSLNTLNASRCELVDLPSQLSSLTELRELDLSNNNFLAGLPTVVGGLSSLKTLTLSRCRLKDLPVEFCGLNQLNTLDIGWNSFTSFPQPVCQLTSMRTLSLCGNTRLERIDEKVLQLKDLTEIDCSSCESLKYPSYDVCQQGLSAVKEFFTRQADASALKIICAPLAVLGSRSSGKTSLLRSLQQRERVLTYRNSSFILVDEATLAFKIEELQLSEQSIKVITYGGHEVYQVAQVLAQKSFSIPVIVVNMKEFVDLSESLGPKRAAEKVLFDWISQLYLACPKLGPPLLVLTHMDQLSPPVAQYKEDLLREAQHTRYLHVDLDRQMGGDPRKHLMSVDYLYNTDLPLFEPCDVFELSSDLQESSSINLLLNKIEERCKEFTIAVPDLWNKVESFIDRYQGVCIAMSVLKKQFNVPNLPVVLRCMHNRGRILWLENNASLSGYIFHKVPAVVDLIEPLFLYTSVNEWEKRRSKFRAYVHKLRKIGEGKYEQLARNFTNTRVIDEALLADLYRRSGFPLDLVLSLLQSLGILYGPLDRERVTLYAIPLIAPDFKGEHWKTDSTLQLRAVLLFDGITIPEHTYQQLTDVVIRTTILPLSTEYLYRDGVAIQRGSQTVYLVHDFDKRSSTLQVSTTVADLGSAWKVLCQAIANIDNFLRTVWTVSYMEICIDCAHCHFIRHPKPSQLIDPDWLFNDDNVIDFNTIETFSGLGRVPCKRVLASDGEVRHVIPKPLVYPCYELAAEEVTKLEKYLSELKPVHRAKTAEKDSEKPAALSDSDLSDAEDEKYCDDTTAAEMNLELMPVRKSGIKALFDKERKVYKMSENCRGRVLIINIKTFTDGQVRQGSEVDYLNLSKLFTSLNFTLAKCERDLTDLSAEQIRKEIRDETVRSDHYSYGMFVLVIMSQGRAGNVILDRDKRPVTLVEMQELLSPKRFPAMKGKPKLIILQAGSGEKSDYGEESDAFSLYATGSTSSDQQMTSPMMREPSPPPPLPPVASGLTFFGRRPPIPRFTRETVLNADDFLIMKASSEPYVATRSSTHGSWFIRVLVATFYKHACHRDVESLFRIIQERVRVVSKVDRSSKTKDYQGGNVPISFCTFTKYRKLFLFPGMRSRRQQ